MTDTNYDPFAPQTWDEYVDDRINWIQQWCTWAEALQVLDDLEAIKQLLDNNPQWHGVTGKQKQENPPECDKLRDYADNYTWRAWGHLMAAYMNSKENKKVYHYMYFYM